MNLLAFKLLVIALLCERRKQNLAYLAKWRADHPNRKKEWDAANRELWQLDHVFPLACCGTDLNQIEAAQFYRNIRPVWNSQNSTKNASLTEESLLAGFLCGIRTIHLFAPHQAAQPIIKKAGDLGFSVVKHYEDGTAIKN